MIDHTTDDLLGDQTAKPWLRGHQDMLLGSKQPDIIGWNYLLGWLTAWAMIEDQRIEQVLSGTYTQDTSSRHEESHVRATETLPGERSHHTSGRQQSHHPGAG